VIIRATGWSLLDINSSGRVDDARCLPQVWQKVISMGGNYTEGMQLFTSGNKVISEIEACGHHFLSNPCIPHI
jgi:hypothetical protein